MQTAAEDNEDARVEELLAEIAEVNAHTCLIFEDYVREWAAAIGPFSGRWAGADERSSVVDFVERWHAQTGISRGRLLEWLGIGSSKFFYWKRQIADAEALQDAPARLAAQ